jgi:Domain of unknown function (DUF1841)
MDALRDQNQERFYEIWTRLNSGYPLQGDDRVIGELMKAHPEYYQFWNDPKRYVHHRFDPATDKLDPFLHILMDLTVKRQIMLDDPPETKRTIEALTSKKGLSEMEAIHQVSSIVVEFMYDTLKTRRPFDVHKFVRRLGQLISG